MKSSLICAVLLTFVSCSAIAADQATPMADIEPMPVMVPKAAITAPNPAEEATVQSGSALDDFSFAAKAQTISPRATSRTVAKSQSRKGNYSICKNSDHGFALQVSYSA